RWPCCRCDKILKSTTRQLFFECPQKPEMLIIDRLPQISLARTIVDQKRGDARSAFNTQAKTSQIEGEHFQRLNGGCSPIAPGLNTNLKTFAGQTHDTLGVLTEQALNDR